MKLFLSSMAISPDQASAFAGLVGKEASNTTIGLIENAADVEAGDKSWVQRNYDDIKANSFMLKCINLRNYLESSDRLAEALQGCDAVWLGGGNTYYLRWILHKTGADRIIKKLVADGMVYGGGSAGAIVAGPTLKHFETADNPSKAPEKILEGLGLTDTVIVPHWEHEKYGSIVKGIDEKLRKDGLKTCTLTDAEALVIDGNSYTKVPEKQRS